LSEAVDVGGGSGARWLESPALSGRRRPAASEAAIAWGSGERAPSRRETDSPCFLIRLRHLDEIATTKECSPVKIWSSMARGGLWAWARVRATRAVALATGPACRGPLGRAEFSCVQRRVLSLNLRVGLPSNVAASTFHAHQLHRPPRASPCPSRHCPHRRPALLTRPQASPNETLAL